MPGLKAESRQRGDSKRDSLPALGKEVLLIEFVLAADGAEAPSKDKKEK